MLESITNFWKHFGKQIPKEKWYKMPKYGTKEIHDLFIKEIELNKETQIKMNIELTEEAKEQAKIDFNNWVKCYNSQFLYDPPRLRWFKVIIAPDPSICVNQNEIRETEFNKLQKDYLNGK